MIICSFIFHNYFVLLERQWLPTIELASCPRTLTLQQKEHSHHILVMELLADSFPSLFMTNPFVSVSAVALTAQQWEATTVVTLLCDGGYYCMQRLQTGTCPNFSCTQFIFRIGLAALSFKTLLCWYTLWCCKHLTHMTRTNILCLEPFSHSLLIFHVFPLEKCGFVLDWVIQAAGIAPVGDSATACGWSGSSRVCVAGVFSAPLPGASPVKCKWFHALMCKQSTDVFLGDSPQ